MNGQWIDRCRRCLQPIESVDHTPPAVATCKYGHNMPITDSYSRSGEAIKVKLDTEPRGSTIIGTSAF